MADIIKFYSPCLSNFAFFAGGNRSRGSSSGQNVGCRADERGRGDARLMKSCKFLEGDITGDTDKGGLPGDTTLFEGGFDIFPCCVTDMAGLGTETPNKNRAWLGTRH